MAKLNNASKRAPSKKGLFANGANLQELARIKSDLELDETDDLWLPAAADVPALREKLDDGRYSRLYDLYNSNIKAKGKGNVKKSERLPWRAVCLLLSICAMALGCDVPSAAVKRVVDNRYTVNTFDKTAMKDVGALCKAYKVGQFYDLQVIEAIANEEDEQSDDGEEEVKTDPRQKETSETPVDSEMKASIERGEQDPIDQESSGDEDEEIEIELVKEEPAAPVKKIIKAKGYEKRPSLQPKLAAQACCRSGRG